MPATTPLGVPYPLGTDRVADGDNAIQSLAEWVDRSITWGACTVGATGPGAGGTMWFNTCSPIGGSPGVTLGANGITVPRKGYYAVQAQAGIAFNQAALNYSSLFIGDGTNVWCRGYTEQTTASNINLPKTVSCLTVVQLPAGTMIRWGMANVGPTAGGVNGGSECCLIARLLHPLA